jgi:arylsulfatase
MADELKPVLARQMEVYAGFLEHTDFHVGRLIDTLEGLGVLDDTLVYYIIGDNGASAEGTLNGTFNELVMLNGAAAFETVESMAAHVDEFGGPLAYNHYAVGWAHAMDTRTSGRSRSPRIGVGRATARSSTGPTASRPRARRATSSAT